MRLEVRYHGQRIGRLDDSTGRMVFNVLAGNRDDHVRNHAFLMHEPNLWQLSPAYDLTPTPELEEHCLSVNGEWIRIAEKDLLEVGKKFSIHKASEILDQIASQLKR
jgi:serine/threonine-protein kinase HipA